MGAVRVRLLHCWLASVHVEIDGGPTVRGGSGVVMLPGPPGHLQTVVDEWVVPEILGGAHGALAVAEVPHEYPETLLIGPLARIRQRHADAQAGSYPGRPMVLRLAGVRAEVESAAADLRSVLAGLAADPSAAAVREAWQSSPAWGAGG